MTEFIDKENQHLIVQCPNCLDFVLIEKLNCCIFRHGILKNNGHQIDPHSSKKKCELLLKNKEIYGCGKPFRIIVSKNEENKNIFTTEICDYL